MSEILNCKVEEFVVLVVVVVGGGGILFNSGRALIIARLFSCSWDVDHHHRLSQFTTTTNTHTYAIDAPYMSCAIFILLLNQISGSQKVGELFSRQLLWSRSLVTHRQDACTGCLISVIGGLDSAHHYRQPNQGHPRSIVFCSPPTIQ